MNSQSALFFAIGILGVASVACAGTVSSCTNDAGDSGFTCNIFETLADGTFSQISNIIDFPTGQTVGSGYVVLLDNISSSETDPTQWFQVLDFIDGGGSQSTTAQLLSFGCNDVNPISCFPTSAEVSAVSNMFMVATPGVTQFVNGFNTFNINNASDPPPPGSVPEPSSTTLAAAGLGLLFLIFSGRKRPLRG